MTKRDSRITKPCKHFRYRGVCAPRRDCQWCWEVYVIQMHRHSDIVVHKAARLLREGWAEVEVDS
jgi:hypothetical protein